MSSIAITVGFLVALAVPAAADDLAGGGGSPGDMPSLGIGARLGGGAAAEAASPSLDGLCFGVFGHVGLSRHLFAEVALDRCAHTLLDGDAAAHDGTQLSAALGVRLLPGAWLSPYLQMGVGGELASGGGGVNDMTDDGIYPLAFVGAGADFSVSGPLKLGMNVRYELGASFADNGAEPDVASATVAQLFLRYDL